MSCYNPKHGFVTGITKNGKPQLRILENRYLSIDSRGVPSTLAGHEEDGDYVNYYLIPCGHCLGCRQDQANEWTNRLLMESKYHDSMYFITLTYDDDHLHGVAWTDEDTGEFHGGYTLDKRDCQLFFKLLRRHFPDDKIRFYLAGEYGPTSGRPHYHTIVFGLHVDDLVPFGVSETGSQYYVSESVANCWKRGFISIEPANEFTIRYVTGYVTKKLGVYPNEQFEREGLVPPFSLSSRKPGIGRQFLDENAQDIIQKDRIVLSTPNGSVQCGIPRYFLKALSDNGYESEIRERSARKVKNANAAIDSISAYSDLDNLDQLKIKERNHKKRAAMRGKV